MAVRNPRPEGYRRTPPGPLPMCDDRGGADRHFWPDDYASGDTCFCGRFYLITNPVAGFAFEVRLTPAEDV
jgi:hypothetical protein